MYYFTLVYFTVSVPVHVRTWFVPDNPQLLRIFPAWYSLFFLVMSTLMTIGWWNLRTKPATSIRGA